MTNLALSLSLPDELVQEANDAGLLTAEAVERLIRAELARWKHQRLREMVDQFATLDIPPLTMEELNEEIRAIRAERRARRARSS